MVICKGCDKECEAHFNEETVSEAEEVLKNLYCNFPEKKKFEFCFEEVER